MKRTGEMLRAAREAKGLSMTEVALTLKINSKILTAIEDGDAARLPAKTFLRGFVQSYAQALKMDTEELMKVFVEEMGSSKPHPIDAAADESSGTVSANSEAIKSSQDGSSFPTGMKSKRSTSQGDELSLERPQRTKTVLISISFIVLVGLIFGTKRVIDRYQRESETSQADLTAPLDGSDSSQSTDLTAVLPLTPVDAPLSTTTESNNEGGLRSESTSTTLSTTTTTLPVPTTTLAAMAAVTTTTTLPPTTTTAKVTTTTLAPTTTTIKVTTTTVKVTTTTSPPTTTTTARVTTTTLAPVTTTTAASAKKSLELIIEAMDSVEIEYSTSKGVSQKLMLATDQVHTLRSKEGLKVKISNGGAVNLILNGRDLGVPGDLGKSINLNY